MLVLQGAARTAQGQNAVITARDDSLRIESELRNPKYQASAGVRYRIGSSLLTFAITENLVNYNNSPDIGFQLGWAYSPEIKP